MSGTRGHQLFTGSWHLSPVSGSFIDRPNSCWLRWKGAILTCLQRLGTSTIDGAMTMAKLVSGVILSAVAIVGLTFGAGHWMTMAHGTDIAARPGAPAPAFTAKDIAGREVHLRD